VYRLVFVGFGGVMLCLKIKHEMECILASCNRAYDLEILRSFLTTAEVYVYL